MNPKTPTFETMILYLMHESEGKPFILIQSWNKDVITPLTQITLQETFISGQDGSYHKTLI